MHFLVGFLVAYFLTRAFVRFLAAVSDGLRQVACGVVYAFAWAWGYLAARMPGSGPLKHVLMGVGVLGVYVVVAR